MRRAILPFLSLALVLIGLASSAEARRVALVIGNSAYKYASELRNPSRDAEAVSAVLKKLGFEVIKGIDLGRLDLEAKIRDFAHAIRGAQTVLFFYAGHGLQVNGRNYLTPVDARLADETDLEFESVRLETVLTQMEREPRTNLVFIDACRDNPMARNLARSMGTRSTAIGRGLARIETGIGMLIAFATQPGNVALDGSGDHSPFTEALLRHIESPGLDVAQLMRRVRVDVIKETSNRQVPWSNSSLTGDFYFATRAVSVEPPKPGQAGDGLEALRKELEALKGRKPPAAVADPAAQAWAAVKDSDSEAVLRTFIGKYPDSIYVDFARAKLEELREKRASVDEKPSADASRFSRSGSYACFGRAVFPEGWRGEATCLHFGCNFGQMSRQACLALGARKGSKTVIHGNTGGGRSNECWLQQSCGDLRPHGDFSLFIR